MISKKLIFLFLTLMLLILTISSSPIKENPSNQQSYYIDSQPIKRSLAGYYKPPAPVRFTCDKYPTVCLARGSPGPFCCNKKCVDLMGDRINCGHCGKKCKYYEMCCGARCVNPSIDAFNCGRCGSRCKKGDKCAYGMCSYA